MGWLLVQILMAPFGLLTTILSGFKKIDLLRNVVVQEVQEFVGDTINFYAFATKFALRCSSKWPHDFLTNLEIKYLKASLKIPTTFSYSTIQLLVSCEKAVEYLDAYDLFSQLDHTTNQ